MEHYFSYSCGASMFSELFGHNMTEHFSRAFTCVPTNKRVPGTTAVLVHGSCLLLGKEMTIGLFQVSSRWEQCRYDLFTACIHVDSVRTI